MSSFTFVPATKAGSKARIALLGTAGAGKTYTALRIAAGLERGDAPLGLIDTERGSAKKYADVFAFRWLGMSSFDPADLTRAVLAAGEQGIGTLIVDTASPFWTGPDGMLDKVGQATTSFEGWRHMRPVERQMFDALLGFAGHVIVNLRTRTEYVVERNDNGKMEPRRVGLKPEQRDGMEHEFDVVLDLDRAGQIARVVKTRCPELAEKTLAEPGAEFGETVQAWLDRDAVGEPLNPLSVRAWALDPARELAELKDRYDGLAAAGQLEAVVYDRDGSNMVGIGDLVLNAARELRRAAAQAAAQAAGAPAGAANGRVNA